MTTSVANNRKSISRIVLALLFITAGSAHLAMPAFFESIVPPYLPWPGTLVFISGLAELGLGLALFASAPVRHWAAWGLIALLIAVFPANIYMAMHTERFPDIPSAVQWARLPLQALLIAWVYWHTR